jgi:hypothetical protein
MEHDAFDFGEDLVCMGGIFISDLEFIVRQRGRRALSLGESKPSITPHGLADGRLSPIDLVCDHVAKESTHVTTHPTNHVQENNNSIGSFVVGEVVGKLNEVIAFINASPHPQSLETPSPAPFPLSNDQDYNEENCGKEAV